MNRKLKTLGLALFAVLAVGATSASAAWGATFHTDGSPTTLIRVTTTVTGITYLETGICGSGSANNGTFVGEVTFTGENSLGEDTDIWWE